MLRVKHTSDQFQPSNSPGGGESVPWGVTATANNLRAGSRDRQGGPRYDLRCHIKAFFPLPEQRY
eukprot:scaffold106424_cov29-Prasinocladus_malaysianus.AAC.2